MPITPNFSTTQLYTDITVLTITDTSSGSDVGLTGRFVYLRKYDGTYLVPSGTTTSYVFWPIGSVSFDIDCLDKDYVLDITVIWLSGSTQSYTKVILSPFTAYSELFLRSLTQAQASNPALIGNKNFWGSKCKLRTLIDDVAQAVDTLNDQTAASFALVEAKKLTDNPQLFY